MTERTADSTDLVTVKDLASRLKLTTEALLALFQTCHILKRQGQDRVSGEEQKKIEDHLEAKREGKNIQTVRVGQVKRCIKMQLSSGVGGKLGTIEVEVRKKRKAPLLTASPLVEAAEPEKIPALEVEKTLPVEEKLDVPVMTASEIKNKPAEHAPSPLVESLPSQQSDRADPASDSKIKEKSVKPWLKVRPKTESSESNKGTVKRHIPSISHADHRFTGLNRPAHGEPGEAGEEIKTRHGHGAKPSRGPKKPKGKLQTRGQNHRNASFRQGSHELRQKFQAPVTGTVREVKVREGLTVAEFADRLSIKAAQLIKELIKLGLMPSLNESLEKDVMELAASNLGYELLFSSKDALEENLLQSFQEASQSSDANLTTRPPIVTVMGHVDHGKTSLLDRIRKTCVAEKEAGGITQQIGAYVAEVMGQKVVFIDTPGHAMFTSMRARGSQITDIAVVVVALEDGVMPQTIEAIQHAKAAQVPILIAVTKIDKIPQEERSFQKIQEALLTHEVVVEPWGGDTAIVGISTKSGEGMDALMEAILFQAECLQLKANHDAPYQGVVLESRVEKGMGPVATLLSQSGHLQKGDMVLCGSLVGKVRILKDAQGENLKAATPSIPVAIYGLPGLPAPGETVYKVVNEKMAKDLADQRKSLARHLKLQKDTQKSRVEAWKSTKEEGESGKELDLPPCEHVQLVLKADTHGSLEAIKATIDHLNSHKKGFDLTLRGSGVGSITEGDVSLAVASQALLIGFNVRPDPSARFMIEREHIKPQYHQVIYALIDGIKQEVARRLPMIKQEIFKGAAEVKVIFRSSKFGMIAGSVVVEGHMMRKMPVKIIRDQKVVYWGELDSLKRGKDDVQEVKQGNECGIGIKNYLDVRIGDRIELYEIKEIAQNPFEKG